MWVRQPPILGGVGIDIGQRPAISFIIPKRAEEEQQVAPDVTPTTGIFEDTIPVDAFTTYPIVAALFGFTVYECFYEFSNTSEDGSQYINLKQGWGDPPGYIDFDSVGTDLRFDSFIDNTAFACSQPVPIGGYLAIEVGDIEGEEPSGTLHYRIKYTVP